MSIAAIKIDRRRNARKSAMFFGLFTVFALLFGAVQPASAEVPSYLTINQGAPAYDLDLDCSALDGSSNAIAQAPNVSMIVNLTSCSDITFEQIDSTFDPGEPGGVSADGAPRVAATLSPASIIANGQLQVFPNTKVVFTDNAANTYELNFYATATAPDPTGVLLKTADITIAGNGNADEMDIPDDGTGYPYLANDPSCEMEAGYHAYATYEVSVQITDVYTFRFIQQDPQNITFFINDFTYSDSLLNDPFLAVYETSLFDPTNDPNAGVIGCNDDADLGDPYITSTGYVGEYAYSEFFASLDQGVAYTLVLMTYGQMDSAYFGSSGLDQTGTFELWGPTGGFGTDIAPYSQTINGTVGTAITDTDSYVPTGFTGSVTYSISPALPNGLNIDPTTGVISGTPSAELATQTFIVTGSDGTDSSSAIVSIEVQAASSPAIYTVTFDSQGGSSVSDSSFTAGGSFSLPQAPTKSGYTFNGWFTSPTGGTALSSPYSPSGTSNITLYAQWSVDSSNSSGGLPNTGSHAQQQLNTAGLLLLGGVLFLAIASLRRRKN